MRKVGRPEGTTKPDTRRNGIRIPLNDEEKRLLETAAKLIVLNHPLYDPTTGISRVWGDIMVDQAKKVMLAFSDHDIEGLIEAIEGRVTNDI